MSHVLLICTVGGAPEPIAASILAHQPERILFVVSAETRLFVTETIVPAVQAHETPLALDPGRFDFVELPSAQDFSLCVQELRAAYGRYVQSWLHRGEGFLVTVDFTGGTKCMTAALALAARRWNCHFSYVGGTERTKDGVGIVVSGKEQIIHSANPWDSLGFEAVDQAVILFNHGDLGAAARILDLAKQQASESVKRGLNTLQQLCEAYDLWDRFQHRDARSRLLNALKAPADLAAWFPASAQQLMRAAESHCQWLERLPADPKAFVLDLLANAQRCATRGRFDDGVARLYRACEAAAQFHLREICLTEAADGKVAIERVPESLRLLWQSRVQEGRVSLGLQDDYLLLESVGDSLGKRFRELELDDRKKSPLNDRNNSILAHGQAPLSRQGYVNLFTAIMNLTDAKESDLPHFPILMT